MNISELHNSNDKRVCNIKQLILLISKHYLLINTVKPNNWFIKLRLSILLRCNYFYDKVLIQIRVLIRNITKY